MTSVVYMRVQFRSRQDKEPENLTLVVSLA